MAQRFLLAGTAYNVPGGKSMVGGTIYNIVKGKTLVDGTGYDIKFKPDASPVLNENDWSVISDVSTRGYASHYWAVGDTKQITLNGTVGNTTFNNLVICAFIVGFDHNSDIEGKNTIHFQIGKSSITGEKNLCLVDSVPDTENGYFSMNDSASNIGGWASSKMRTVLLGSPKGTTSPLSGSLIAALPKDVRNVMKYARKYSDNRGGGYNLSSYVTATYDCMWLPSIYEIRGYTGSSNSYESDYQKQYAYYANGNSLTFYRYNDTSSKALPWSRSAHNDSDSRFCFCTEGNTIGSANMSAGLSPMFCV